jgi:hypothetical protein
MYPAATNAVATASSFRPVDDDVDVIEPMAQHRDRDADREQT